jgi:predicted phosphodiesterase
MAAAVRCTKCQSYKSPTAPCKRCVPELPPQDEELLLTNIVLAKGKQRVQDTLTRERRTFREYARVENGISEYLEHLCGLLAEGSFRQEPPQHLELQEENGVLLVQLSDLHFIETIKEAYNSYNFEIASKRLAKLASRIKNVIAGYKINKVIVACLGDIINSDRRLEESKTNQETRAKGTLVAADILQGFLRDVAQYAPVVVYGITGNEGRVDKDITWDERTATNNFDFMVYHILRTGFKDHEHITFGGFNSHEMILDIMGQKILCVHGHQVGSNVEKWVLQAIGKHATQGNMVNFVLMGHIHASYLGDYHSRNASLAGGNGYSGNALGCASKAAQMLHVITPGSIDGIKVDLQDTTGMKAYPVDPEWSEHFIEQPLLKIGTKSIVIQVPVT